MLNKRESGDNKHTHVDHDDVGRRNDSEDIVGEIVYASLAYGEAGTCRAFLDFPVVTVG